MTIAIPDHSLIQAVQSELTVNYMRAKIWQALLNNSIEHVCFHE